MATQEGVWARIGDRFPMGFLCPPRRAGSLSYAMAVDLVRCSPHPPEADMLDIVFVAAGLASLAVCLGYVLICDRL